MKNQILFALITLFSLGSCAVKKEKDMGYTNSHATPKLNVFHSAVAAAQPVLIFIHGGNWNTGNKNTYNIMARNFAKKGMVMVVPDYTLSPDADYDQMAQEVAQAIRWTQQNISKYNIIIVIINTPSSAVETISQYVPNLVKAISSFEKGNFYFIE